MDLNLLIYFIPILPILVRGFFTLKVKKQLNTILTEKELDRSNIRNIVLVLAGFSFTALLALILVETNTKHGLLFPIYFSFISFIIYLITFNLQGYKSKRWEEIISDTLLETASLCLVLTVIHLIFSSGLNKVFIYLIATIGIIGWAIDFFIRLKIQFKYLNKRRSK
jgi:hypothetical protein